MLFSGVLCAGEEEFTKSIRGLHGLLLLQASSFSKPRQLMCPVTVNLLGFCSFCIPAAHTV